MRVHRFLGLFWPIFDSFSGGNIRNVDIIPRKRIENRQNLKLARDLMYKLKIYSIGKTKENWLHDALREYEERLKSSLSIEWILAKDDEQLMQFLNKEMHFICLDPEGKEYTSEKFSSFLLQSLQDMNSRLTFVIGGSLGLPKALKQRAKSLLSLSKLTFTHQITRLILIEQIYRALEIEKGTPYHK